MGNTLSRRDVLKVAGGAAAGAMLAPELALCRENGTRRPNIVFIMTDDHAANAISAYGSYRNATPNIDRLADEGMRFQNCFCTNSICAPSRACVLTGVYSTRNGVVNNHAPLRDGQVIFPTLLHRAGYQTAIVGKWISRTPPEGFDYHCVWQKGEYYNPVVIENGEQNTYEGYANPIYTDQALGWIKKRDPEKPFCLLLHPLTPHRNWQPGPEYLDKYDAEDIPEPPTLFDAHENRSDAAREQEMSIGEHLRMREDLMVDYAPKGLNAKQEKRWIEAFAPENKAFKKANPQGKEFVRWKYQRFIKNYLRCVASIDDEVGRVLDFLDENGLAENTIVVYTSDQGFFLGEHGWFDKRFMYEESLRMPFLVRYPREVAPGSVNSDIILNIDFAPTFLDLAGLAPPSEIQGESFRPLLHGWTPEDWRDAMYYHYLEYPAVHMVKRHYGIRTKQYKLIHYYHDIDQWELFDLEKDPREMNSVYENPEYAGVVKTLKTRLKQLRVQCGDTDEAIKSYLGPQAREEVNLE